ncbi:unnamed protein product [Mytilus coruscus]|uniref:Fucolectin tachylectin-4 pentraxin-1 domain-containing protein n=1 Tax=Mytilus coruscus TaxID=42192 RepID=A0A6J8BLX8_MYTCO|nr:unnamed protein product [Mytilus coruscus]
MVDDRFWKYVYHRKGASMEENFAALNDSDFEIRIHNTSDWSSQYSLCYKQIGQAPTELYVNCTDFISGKYLTVYKKNDHHNYPLTLCEVEVYGSETTVNKYISGHTTLGIPSGNHITYESRHTTLGTTIGDYITHDSNFSSSTRLTFDILTTGIIKQCNIFSLYNKEAVSE